MHRLCGSAVFVLVLCATSATALATEAVNRVTEVDMAEAIYNSLPDSGTSTRTIGNYLSCSTTGATDFSCTFRTPCGEIIPFNEGTQIPDSIDFDGEAAIATYKNLNIRLGDADPISPPGVKSWTKFVYVGFNCRIYKRDGEDAAYPVCHLEVPNIQRCE